MGTTYAHGDPVDSWKSVTPDEYTLTAAGSTRPTFETDTTLGKGVSFDAIDDIMSLTSGVAIDPTSGITLCVVFERGAFTSLRGLVQFRAAGASATNPTLSMYNAGATNMAVAETIVTAADMQIRHDARDMGVPHVYTSRVFNITSVAVDEPVWIDGADAGGTELGTWQHPNKQIEEIYFGWGWNVRFLGKLHAVVLYNGRDATPSEIVEIHASLNSRFGVY